jgi:hypothetical protein
MVNNKFKINLDKIFKAHGRNKHIETNFHFHRDQVNMGKITLIYYKSDDQDAIVLTKPLKNEKFKEMRKMLNAFSLKNLN